MDQLSDSLVKRLNQRSLTTTATAAYVCHVAAQLSAGRYRVVSFRNRTLTLAASSGSAAQDLRLVAEPLCNEINNRLTSSVVARLRIVNRPNRS